MLYSLGSLSWIIHDKFWGLLVLTTFFVTIWNWMPLYWLTRLWVCWLSKLKMVLNLHSLLQPLLLYTCPKNLTIMNKNDQNNYAVWPSHSLWCSELMIVSILALCVPRVFLTDVRVAGNFTLRKKENMRTSNLSYQMGPSPVFLSLLHRNSYCSPW